jgi:hypothetical protein
MTSLEKISAYLDTINVGDDNYDYACYIREKLASVSPDPSSATADNDIDAQEENNEADQLQTANPDKSKQNHEGSLMDGAFKDLDVLNKLDEEKEIKIASPVKDLLSKLSKRK